MFNEVRIHNPRDFDLGNTLLYEPLDTLLALDAVLVLLLLLRAAAISAHPGLEGLVVHHSGGTPIPAFTDVLRLREGGELSEPRLLYSWTVGIDPLRCDIDPRRLTERRLLFAGFGPHATK